jgi:hypothetical protein
MTSHSQPDGSSKSGRGRPKKPSSASQWKIAQVSSQHQQRLAKPQINLQSRFDASFCTLLIEHMSAGYSFTSFAAVAKVSPTTIQQWVRQHQAFADAKAYGESACLHYKEKLVYAITTGQMKGDLKGAIFLLKTDKSRAYSEQVEVHMYEEENLSDEQIESEIKRLAMRADVIDTEAVASEPN